MSRACGICRDIEQAGGAETVRGRGDPAGRRSVHRRARLRGHIRANGVSNLHPVGTCRMGRAVDDVVDPQLRVHGIERAARGRRLDHAPASSTGNTNAPSIMIGEKCADMVRQAAPVIQPPWRPRPSTRKV